MFKKQMLFGFAAVLMAGAVAAPAMAASGGYSSPQAAPTIRQTNFEVTSSNWSVPSSTPSTGSITSVSWSIGYTSTSQGTIQVKVS
jgi:hypothetical protein